MEKFKAVLIAQMIIVSFSTLTAFRWTETKGTDNNKQSHTENSFAVLELFTSEGCNSCPPAEELLEKINSDAKGKPVYILNYHVDYFDKLGWKDVFGSPENTKRQQKYSSWLNAQVYTPQMVINGTKEYIGSYEKEIRNNLAEQLRTKRTANLSLEVKKNTDLISVTYQAKDNQVNDDLVLALVQRNGQTAVRRGENAGRTLSHIQIVRKISIVSLKDEKSGTVELHVPKTASLEQWEVIGMLQNRETGTISAASSAEAIL